jgi:putative DNA primase/helicase
VAGVSAPEQFLAGLDALGVPIFTASPGTESEYVDRPGGWADLGAAGNGQRRARWQPGDALCGVMGGRVAGLDCDPRNGCDPADVRRMLTEIGVGIYAEIATPGDGAHFYVPGHPDLATAYTLDGWPGLEVHSYGSCLYLPGTARPKYDGRGYRVVRDDLAALLDGDDDSAVALLDWVDTHRPGSGESFPLAPRWNGTAPDRRQAAYLAAALSGQAAELAAMAPDTGRNRALYVGALKLGNYVAGAGLAEHDVTEALTVACERNGLARDDGARSVAASIRSGLRNGVKRPRAVPPAPESENLEIVAEPVRPALLADPLPSEPRSELGYARRFVAVFGDQVRYVPAWRRWLVWDGKRWAHDETGQVARWAKTIARRVTTDAAAIVNKDERKAALNIARRGESAAGVAGMLTLAGTESGIAVTPDELDADPWLLNCMNGVLDLRTGQLGPHDPALMLTKLAGAAYEPDATGAEFDKFLARIQPDAAMREYLSRLLGHALLGTVREHILPIWFGVGANGKGSLTDATLTALGDYGDAADPDLLTARSFDAHPTGTANLHGLRLAVLHESDAGRRLAEGTVKRLTGGDRVKARRMREDFWSFAPSHTFLMLTNHKPIVSGTDEGIWRRLRLVPFDVVIPLAERDDELGERLHGEADAVLAWLVAGFHGWRANGLADPEPVTRATEAYRTESDMLGRFLDQRCLLGPHFTVRSAELFEAWSRWCAAEGEQAGTQTAFSTAMLNRGFDSKHTNRGTVWHGVGLAAEED